MTIKSISFGSFGRDYSSITAWHAAFPGGSGTWEGECYNDATFVEAVTLGGTSSCPETLRTATGQSAFDTNTNPLKYDESKGVALKTTTGYAVPLTLGSYVTVSGLQIRSPTTANSSVVFINGSITNTFLTRFLVLHTIGTDAVRSFGGGSNCSVTNGVIISYTARPLKVGYATGYSFANLTIVSPSDQSNTGYGIEFQQSPSCKNVAVFGCDSGFSTGGTPSGSNNATDAASIAFGSSNQTSLTYANQFTSVTAAAQDFTLVTGSTLKDNGNTDTTDIPGAVDIFNTARPQGSAWDIGAHEFISGGGGGTVRRSMASLGVG